MSPSKYTQALSRVRATKQRTKQEEMARRNAFNVPTAVSQHSKEGEVYYMAPCAGQASELTVRAKPDCTVTIFVGLANVTGETDEDGMFLIDDSLDLRAGDVVKCVVQDKDGAPVEAYVSFLFYNIVLKNKSVEAPVE